MRSRSGAWPVKAASRQISISTSTPRLKTARRAPSLPLTIKTMSLFFNQRDQLGFAREPLAAGSAGGGAGAGAAGSSGLSTGGWGGGAAGDGAAANGWGGFGLGFQFDNRVDASGSFPAGLDAGQGALAEGKQASSSSSLSPSRSRTRKKQRRSSPPPGGAAAKGRAARARARPQRNRAADARPNAKVAGKRRGRRLTAQQRLQRKFLMANPHVKREMEAAQRRANRRRTAAPPSPPRLPKSRKSEQKGGEEDKDDDLPGFRFSGGGGGGGAGGGFFDAKLSKQELFKPVSPEVWSRLSSCIYKDKERKRRE